MNIVVTARKNGRGGNLLTRIKPITDGLLTLTEQCGLGLNSTDVEWNPPVWPVGIQEPLPAMRKL